MWSGCAFDFDYFHGQGGGHYDISRENENEFSHCTIMETEAFSLEAMLVPYTEFFRERLD